MSLLTTFSSKLWAAGALLAVLFLVQAGLSLRILGQQADRADAARAEVLVLRDQERMLLALRLSLAQFLGTTLAKEQERYAAQVAERQAALDALGEGRRFDQAGWDTFTATAAEVIKLHLDLRTKKARELADTVLSERYDALAAALAGSSREVEARSQAEARRQRRLVLAASSATAALALALLGGLILLAQRQLARPLAAVAAALDRVAHGDLSIQVAVASRDEVGLMADACNRTIAALREVLATVAHNAADLAQAADRLRDTGRTLVDQAQESDRQAAAARGNAEAVSHRAHDLAAGTAQMQASIREIAQSTAAAAEATATATALAREADGTVAKLAEAGQEIDAVVRLIARVAQQTNLLALNASIEAANAGAAGRGFDVVATEVKTLAQQTAAATGEITQRIATIRAGTRDSLDRIRGILATITGLRDLQVTVAGAVEEQQATTAEMVGRADEAATGTTGIVGALDQVATVAQGTNASAASMGRAADELARLAGELRTAVARLATAH